MTKPPAAEMVANRGAVPGTTKDDIPGLEVPLCSQLAN